MILLVCVNDKKELLAYCGFYCGDCTGYTGVIADAASGFKNLLEKWKFDDTIKCVFPEKLKDYPRFLEMLEFMTDLKCGKICRDRMDSDTTCRVRRCCREKGFFACYECDDFEICEKLKSLFEGLHYEVSLKNLRAIREIGLETWLAGLID